MAKIDVNALNAFLLTQTGEQVQDLLNKINASAQFTQAEKDKLATIASYANAYKHPTGDGNYHVPANGDESNGLVLFSGQDAGDYYWGKINIDDVDGLREIAKKVSAIPFDISKEEVSAEDSKFYWITLDGTDENGECAVFPIKESGMYEVTGYEAPDMPIGVFKDFKGDIVGYINQNGVEDYTISSYIVSAPKGAETLWVNAPLEDEAIVSAISYKFLVGYDNFSEEVQELLQASGGIIVTKSDINGNILVNGEEVTVYEHPTGNGNQHIPVVNVPDGYVLTTHSGEPAWRPAASGSSSNVVNASTHYDFPSIGDVNTIYKAESEKLLYQWNPDELTYEPLASTVVTEEQITLINGGNASLF